MTEMYENSKEKLDVDHGASKVTEIKHSIIYY